MAEARARGPEDVVAVPPDREGMAGLVVLAVFVIVAIFAPSSPTTIS